MECYGARFPILHKDDVNGAQATDYFKFLRPQSGLYNAETQQTRQVPWNFTKFLVNRNADRVIYFNPRTDQKEIVNAIKDMISRGTEKVF